MAGRIIAVTGAGGEIGSALVAAYPKSGDRVFLGGRGAAKLEELASKLRKQNPGVEYEPWECDLGSLTAVKESADRLASEVDHVDVFFQNAGIMATKRWETPDGFEGQMGVCHLGHFALTGHLMPLLLSSGQPRVVTTCSSTAWFGTINFDDLMGEKKYSRYQAYCQVKLANVLFAFELNKRAEAAGRNLKTNSAHPGFVYGHLQEQAVESGGFLEKVMYRTLVKHVIAQSVEVGIEPLMLAADSEKGGLVFGPKWFSRGKGMQVKPPKKANDQAAAEKLWRVSAELTGVDIKL